MNDLGARLRAPSLDATALEDPQGFFNSIMRRCAENVRVAMPCRIEKYDRVNHIADLRVLFNWQMADGSIIDGCILKNITIRRLLAGGFLIDFPILEGDTGWLFACDRDAYDSKKESAPRLPTTPLVDSYESGFWLPDQWGSDEKLGIGEIHEIETNRLVIQSKDGKQKISLGRESYEGEVPETSGDIRITSKTDNNHKTTILIKNGDITVDTTGNLGVNVGGNADIKVSGETNVHCPAINIDGSNGGNAACTIKGTLHVTGDISSDADVIPSSGFTLNNHKHTGDGGPAIGPTSKPDGNL